MTAATTARVDLVYRPLRIGWAVQGQDLDSVRTAIRFSHALWGGRFDPILPVERADEAKRIAELFRVDVVLPIGDSTGVKAFAESFGHLHVPWHTNLFLNDGRWGRSSCSVLDIVNACSCAPATPGWTDLKRAKVCHYTWDATDPLSDVFSLQFGQYPSVEEVGVEYVRLLVNTSAAENTHIAQGQPLPAEIAGRPGLAAIGRVDIHRHHSIRPGWDVPGFFLGTADSPADLIDCWNLRACDIPLWFVDLNYLDRYRNFIPAWHQQLQRIGVRGLLGRMWSLALWSRKAPADNPEPFASMNLVHHQITADSWDGGAVIPPMMYLGEASTLGVVEAEGDGSKISFALAGKPFSEDRNFFTQHLVASVSLVSSRWGDQQATYDVPHVPELNEYYARQMVFHYDRLRVEADRVGIIVTASEHDCSLKSVPINGVFDRVFELAGFKTKPSNAGQIARQLLTQLGGPQGARAFKIPGVRKLLKQYGPRDIFTLEMAIKAIADKSAAMPKGTFGAHADLHIEKRPPNTKLTPADAFAFMMDKGLFRMGHELECSRCLMKSWVSLDVLKQQTTCDLCGNHYDATRQLIGKDWGYRRSGVLGSERNAQGAIPVALAIQQLHTAWGLGSHVGLHTPSLDLKPIDANSGLPSCEVDLVWLVCGGHGEKVAVVLGECKDEWQIDQADVNNLFQVATAFPSHRFDTFFLFVKVAAFTPKEIEMFRELNAPHRNRVILLSARDLEPYLMYSYLEDGSANAHAGGAQTLADLTTRAYFQ